MRARLCRCVLALALACLWSSGCAEDLCKSREPAFQVDLILSPRINAAGLHRLTADVSAAGLRKAVPLAVTPLKTTRRASFDVTVGPAGARGFEAEVRVEATDARARVVARGGLKFKGSADACNLISLALGPPPSSDGGAGPDFTPTNDGKAPPQHDLVAVDLPLPDANTLCGKDGTSCKEGHGTCYKGKCCTGCWTGGFKGFICMPGNTEQQCGLGGGICATCLPFIKCKNGVCIPPSP